MSIIVGILKVMDICAIINSNFLCHEKVFLFCKFF